MFCPFLLNSKVTQLYICIHSFSHNIFHHVPSQVTGYISLCYTAGPHCLSTPNAIVCIYEPQTPSPSHSFPLPLGNHKSILYVHEFVSVLLIGSFVPYFTFLFFSGLHLQHMEIPRLGNELELQLLAYATATAT